MLDRLYEVLLGLGASDSPGTMEAVDSVERAYSNPLRYYHNLHHICSCLVECDSIKVPLDDPLAVEVALWFHDVVYDSLARDNEERSAAVASR